MSSEALEAKRLRENATRRNMMGLLMTCEPTDVLALLAEVARLEQAWRESDKVAARQHRRAEAAEAALAVAREREQRLLRKGTKLADAAERLEQNPLANCLPRFRYPVVDAIEEWRAALVDEPAAAADPGSSSGKTPGFDPGDAGSIPAPGMQRLREALVAAAIPLEVLAGQIRTKPYRELTDELQAEIERAVQIVRAALEIARTPPAAATLAEPAVSPSGKERP